MYNLMIIEKNPYELEKILNHICEKFKNIRICYISYNDKNILDILEKFTIDMILVDCKSNEIGEISFIDYIQENNLYQYSKSIIIKSDNIINLDKYKKNKYIFSYTNTINTMQKDIKNLIKYKDKQKDLKNIRDKIKEELINIDYNYAYKGTKYLEEVILEIYKFGLEFDGNLSKNIYPIIAQRYNKKTDTIYGNIKQSTNLMTYHCDNKKLCDYFGYCNLEKPKVQEVIFTILSKIK